MGNPRFSQAGYRLAASLHGERLWLADDLQRRLVAEMTARIDTSSRLGSAKLRLNGSTASGMDYRAFSRSVACERLAVFQLLLGDPLTAFGTLCEAAYEALCGGEYDHGEVSLPSRFLRIRFYRLWDRILALKAAEPLLRDVPIDSRLPAEARRLGGQWL